MDLEKFSFAQLSPFLSHLLMKFSHINRSLNPLQSDSPKMENDEHKNPSLCGRIKKKNWKGEELFRKLYVFLGIFITWGFPNFQLVFSLPPHWMNIMLLPPITFSTFQLSWNVSPSYEMSNESTDTEGSTVHDKIIILYILLCKSGFIGNNILFFTFFF